MLDGTVPLLYNGGMKPTYSLFEASGFTMATGCEMPDDYTLMNATFDADEPTHAMAQLLVMGDDFSKDDISADKIAQIPVIVMLLSWSKEVGTKDIHKIVDLPIEILKRWNYAWDLARREGHLDDGIMSIEDMNQAFEGWFSSSFWGF